jgi:hypothetical protein
MLSGRKVFTDARDNTLDGIYLPVEKAETVLRMILEGNSVSSVERITEVHKATILKLLVLAEKCAHHGQQNPKRPGLEFHRQEREARPSRG